MCINNYDHKQIRKNGKINNIIHSSVFQVFIRKSAYTIVELRWSIFIKPAMKNKIELKREALLPPVRQQHGK